MAQAPTSRTFKPTNTANARPLPPPRAYIEPLSPPKPAPIEPNFNYPALNTTFTFPARPDPAFSATPRSRSYSTNHAHSHKRTPSTIDTLAEAALALSPVNHAHSRHSSTQLQSNGYNHAHPMQHVYGHGEPPHKRARSEMYSTPTFGGHASRPATSYEPNSWSHRAHSGGNYESRVEEAALLLNFQSGGSPGQIHQRTPSIPLTPAPASRPHANSFPQSINGYSNSAELFSQRQHPVLPPFHAFDAHQAFRLPSLPEQVLTEVPVYEQSPQLQPTYKDVTMMHGPAMPSTQTLAEQSSVPAEDHSSRAQSTDITVSETSDAPRHRKGWPKGKPRNPGARKTMAEKAASKRAAPRKKASEPKVNRSNAVSADDICQPASKARRKSFSDAFAFDQQSPDPVRSLRGNSVPRDVPLMIREASVPKAARKKPIVHPDTVCAGCQTSREAAPLRSEFDEWISCNGCKKWYHIDCAGFKKTHDVRDVDKYFCVACEPQHGKTTYVRKSTRAHASVDYAELQRGVLKTSEESVEHHYIKPIKDGTFEFDPEMFPRIRPEMATREFFEKSGTFTEPICIPAEWNPRPWAGPEARSGSDTKGDTASPTADLLTNPLAADLEFDDVQDNGQDQLEMIMPQGLTVRSVCNLVGGDWPIDVIDVKTQNSGAKWTLARWADYYEEVSDDKAIRNVISLEVSQTRLGRLLQRPKVVRDLDLQDDVWPQEEIDKGKFPKVQFYCLMSVADSYTDFHIDFGGSSVYYHILKGKKTFFFIPPKAKHLKAYEEWNDSPQQNYTFLPSVTKECYRVDLSEGDTMLIPSGWIHAVWTPEDSLVIGGNFLNRLSYKNQFRVVEIEKNNETPMKFRYPGFQKVMWYTAIQYLKADPLPPEVSQMFYEGKQFERQVPVWSDFEGDTARDDSRPGAANARYYSQAEVDGLPDLVNFIFRTVMLVMGRIEGITADRMKRVNASIPKGYGEPLEVAKTFALWVAWKRGNEDPPAWAHPDAVLPSSKEEGPPKKLSERKLKELERKEAIAAWRVAPDRQSARVMTKIANAPSYATTTSPDATSSPAPAQQPDHQMQTPIHPTHAYAPSSNPALRPLAAYLNIPTGSPYISTPKTSVLGPKRVACDACRKRRIKCKHKDLVQQIPINGAGHVNGAIDPALHIRLAPEMSDNITVTTSTQGANGRVLVHGDGSLPNGDGYGDFAAANPGTSAYLSQHIPMTMNGVTMFGDAKRGRSKACLECRRSKRRCIHDENGNVDPGKAAESPIPRSGTGSKKRQSSEARSPVLKKARLEETSPAFSPPIPPSVPQQTQLVGHGVLKPTLVGVEVETKKPTPKRVIAAADRRHSAPSVQPEQAPPEPENIDPELFALYQQQEQNGMYLDPAYAYHDVEQMNPYHQMQTNYQIPTLEQIASEVLEMDPHDPSDQRPNGHLPDGFDQIRAFNATDEEMAMADGLRSTNVHTNGSVDSAVSLSGERSQKSNDLPAAAPDGDAAMDEKSGVAALPNDDHCPNGVANAHQSIENGTEPPQQARPTTASSDTSNKVNDLPLWQPPAPLSTSPVSVKKQMHLANGVNAENNVPSAGSISAKRKRDSHSVTPSAKKAKVYGPLQADELGSGQEDRQSVELAKMLQQEDLGLRRRS